VQLIVTFSVHGHDSLSTNVTSNHFWWFVRFLWLPGIFSNDDCLSLEDFFSHHTLSMELVGLDQLFHTDAADVSVALAQSEALEVVELDEPIPQMGAVLEVDVSTHIL
jgi:hypothetical protein